MPAYPTYKLGEVIDKVTIVFKVKQKEYLADGKFPIIDQGQNLIGGYSNDEKQLINAELPVIVFGDHTKVKKYIDFPFVAGADGTKIIKPKKEFFSEPKLFYYFLHCLKFPDKGYARHFQYLLKSEISVPPLATQHLIVTRIESLFAELDKGVEKLKTAQQQLKVYRQAVLNDCLTKGSEKWKIVKLGEVAEMCLGKMLDKNKNKGNYQPYLRNVNVRWGSFDLSDLLEMRFEDSEQERYGLQNGDLIMCEGGEPGRCAIWNGEAHNMKIQKALHRIRLKPSVLNKYVYYLFYHYAQNGLLEKYFTGTTIKHLTGQSLKSIEIPLPSLPEQQRIVQEIETRLSACDVMEKSINESLQQAEALRQSILKKAFSGELV